MFNQAKCLYLHFIQLQLLLDAFVHIRDFLELINHESHLWAFFTRPSMNETNYMSEFTTHIVLFLVNIRKKILLSKESVHRGFKAELKRL